MRPRKSRRICGQCYLSSRSGAIYAPIVAAVHRFDGSPNTTNTADEWKGFRVIA